VLADDVGATSDGRSPLLREVQLPSLFPSSLEECVTEDRWRRFCADLDDGRAALEGRTFWHVSSTSTGGGVAELLNSVLG
jgi:hypothetical protein